MWHDVGFGPHKVYTCTQNVYYVTVWCVQNTETLCTCTKSRVMFLKRASFEIWYGVTCFMFVTPNKKVSGMINLCWLEMFKALHNTHFVAFHSVANFRFQTCIPWKLICRLLLSFTCDTTRWQVTLNFRMPVCIQSAVISLTSTRHRLFSVLARVWSLLMNFQSL